MHGDSCDAAATQAAAALVLSLTEPITRWSREVGRGHIGGHEQPRGIGRGGSVSSILLFVLFGPFVVLSAFFLLFTLTFGEGILVFGDGSLVGIVTQRIGSAKVRPRWRFRVDRRTAS